MNKIGFYPGCSLTGTAREYNESVQALAHACGVELVELADWNCCGATAAHSVGGERLSAALPARILALAEQQGFSRLLVPCASCYNRLAVTQHTLAANAELRSAIADEMGLPYAGRLQVMNVVQFMDTCITREAVRERVKAPFVHKVACYYGCLLVRPHNVLRFDRVEDPQTMDEWMRTIGVEPIDWAFKTECCGAGLSVPRTDVVARLSGSILEDAVLRGAEAVVVACPMCHSNLDLRRPEINAVAGHRMDIPVIYITQAVGLALGLPAATLGLQRHFVPTGALTHI